MYPDLPSVHHIEQKLLKAPQPTAISSVVVWLLSISHTKHLNKRIQTSIPIDVLTLKYLLGHTVQKLRVISDKCPKAFDSFFSLYGIGTYIKTLK